ncbi:hypothetical protein BESB_039060 [Besnoitia besnoiti]|uniref:SCP domain-containing protein n=1 Tax=Besnoitia besnoiti TaxID=94643 RepID=A0A2A9MG10_BESBE|nr:hypothetical protein BESB_039060 [Besnoitia besnoiti]PFH37448.1 hypothetical protein BESB_039060 [Besnoitia besnoiti]
MEPHPLGAMSANKQAEELAFKIAQSAAEGGCAAAGHFAKTSNILGGENIYVKESSPSGTCKEAVESWYNTIGIFENKFPSTTWEEDDKAHTTYPFLQLMWEKTTGVGCVSIDKCGEGGNDGKDPKIDLPETRSQPTPAPGRTIRSRETPGTDTLQPDLYPPEQDTQDRYGREVQDHYRHAKEHLANTNVSSPSEDTDTHEGLQGDDTYGSPSGESTNEAASKHGAGTSGAGAGSTSDASGLHALLASEGAFMAVVLSFLSHGIHA